MQFETRYIQVHTLPYPRLVSSRSGAGNLACALRRAGRVRNDRVQPVTSTCPCVAARDLLVDAAGAEEEREDVAARPGLNIGTRNLVNLR
jgi:hypothetical protein